MSIWSLWLDGVWSYRSYNRNRLKKPFSGLSRLNSDYSLFSPQLVCGLHVQGRASAVSFLRLTQLRWSNFFKERFGIIVYIKPWSESCCKVRAIYFCNSAKVEEVPLIVHHYNFWAKLCHFLLNFLFLKPNNVTLCSAWNKKKNLWHSVSQRSDCLHIGDTFKTFTSTSRFIIRIGFKSGYFKRNKHTNASSF